jgi:hypothetical protein
MLGHGGEVRSAATVYAVDPAYWRVPVEFHSATVHDMVCRGVRVDTAVIHYARAWRTLPDCDARQRG